MRGRSQHSRPSRRRRARLRPRRVAPPPPRPGRGRSGLLRSRAARGPEDRAPPPRRPRGERDGAGDARRPHREPRAGGPRRLPDAVRATGARADRRLRRHPRGCRRADVPAPARQRPPGAGGRGGRRRHLPLPPPRLAVPPDRLDDPARGQPAARCGLRDPLGADPPGLGRRRARTALRKVASADELAVPQAREGLRGEAVDPALHRALRSRRLLPRRRDDRRPGPTSGRSASRSATRPHTANGPA